MRFISYLRSIFALPDFETPQETRQASILNAIIWLILIISSARLVIIALDPNEVFFTALGERFGGVGMMLMCLVLLQRGYMRAASALLIGGTVITTGMVSVTLGNLAGDPFVIGIGLIVVSGLIVSPRGVLWTGVSIILMALGATYLFETGRAVGISYTQEPSWGTGLSVSLTYGALTYLLYLGAGSLDRLLDKLTRMNNDLNEEIEERNKASEALRQNRAELQMTLDYAPIGIMMLDVDGNLLRCNQALCNIVGYSADAIMGGPVYTIFDPQSLADFETQLFNLLEGHTDKGDVNAVLLTNMGSTRHTKMTMGIVHDRTGQPLRIIATIEDITERRRIEEQLQLAQKQESIGILAGGIAHDFNNLLVSILGQSSLALKRIEIGKAPDKNIRKVVQGAEKAALLTRQLLAYAGKGQVNVRQLSLNELLLENKALLSVALPRGVSLESDLYDSLPNIVGDAGQLQQVIMNLIINAGDAMPSRGGTIMLKTAFVELDNTETMYWQIGKEALPTGEYVLLEVADNGHGMDSDTLGRIFDPFFTTKEHGHGLGLAAVLGIVRSHGGSMRVYSRPKVGTSFRMLFPVADGTSPIDADELILALK